jgi:peptide/nickel transport system permease protein
MMADLAPRRSNLVEAAVRARTSDRGAAIEGRGAWRLAWARFRRDRVGVASVIVILAIVLVAVGAPFIAQLVGHDPNAQFRDIGLSPEGIPVAPNRTFWFGADELGRDVLVRVAYGARISLVAGVLASSLAVAVGVVVGLTAGYFGSTVDAVLSRFMDVVLSFPYLLFALALVSIIGPSLPLSIVVIAFFSWASVGRVIRGQTLSLREREFVEAARALGASDLRIMFVDILPNLTAPIAVYATLLIPLSIVFEATLSFLGLGIVPPTPAWGEMLSSSVAYYKVAWWFVLAPGAALLVTTLAFNLFGDSVRDALDPRGELLFHKNRRS